jgi:mannan endo-1,6-alpha-mannosidase
MVLAPFTIPQIAPYLATTALAALRQCSGGTNSRLCGLTWTSPTNKWDGTTGAGQQMSVMEAVLSNMINFVAVPVTNSTGGTSTGDVGAGNPKQPEAVMYEAPTTANKAGAGAVSVLLIMGMLGFSVWICGDWNENSFNREEMIVSERTEQSIGSEGSEVNEANERMKRMN